MPDNFNTYLKELDLDVFRKYCEEHGQLETFAPGEPFVQQVHKSRRWGFILSGVFTYSTTDNRGNEHIVGFAFPQTLVGDYMGTVNQRAAIVDIKAAGEVEVMVCPAQALRELIETDNRNLRVKMAENLFDDAYHRFVNQYCLTPRERYLELLEKCPKLLQHVSLTQLASYLRITPTYLSRIRKNI